eukprot:5433026-Pyramimonas_sp.AAC.1
MAAMGSLFFFQRCSAGIFRSRKYMRGHARRTCARRWVVRQHPGHGVRSACAYLRRACSRVCGAMPWKAAPCRRAATLPCW